MKILSIIVAMLLMLSCKKEIKELPQSETAVIDTGLVITYGAYRGWCAGDDSLTITTSDLSYLFYSPCDKSEYAKREVISQEERTTLIKSLDLEAFEKLNLNSCNVCVDGTDYWISIKKDSYYHRIRYGNGDSMAISNIKVFVKELDRLKDKFE